MAKAKTLEELNKKYGIKGSTTPTKNEDRKQSKSASSSSKNSKSTNNNTQSALDKLNEKYGITGNVKAGSFVKKNNTFSVKAPTPTSSKNTKNTTTFSQPTKSPAKASTGEKFLDSAGYYGEKLGRGIIDGLEGITDFAWSALGAVGWGVTSGLGFFENDVSRGINKWYNDINENDITDLFGNAEERYDAAPDWVKDSGWLPETIGNIVPFMAETIATGGAGATDDLAVAGKSVWDAGRKLLTNPDVHFGMSAGGNAIETAIEKGANPITATSYGTAAGALEVATEKLFGGYAGTGVGRTAKTAIKETTDATNKTLLKKIWNSPVTRKILDIGSEGIEEQIVTLGDPILQRATGVDANAEWASWKDYVESGTHGVILSVVMNAVGMPVSKYHKSRVISSLNESTEALNGLIQDDTLKLQPLPNNATEEEIVKRQKEVSAVALAFDNAVKKSVQNEQQTTVGQTVDPLEQTAREVVAERNRTPITADEVKKATGFGDSGAVLITKLMNDNGVSFESAKSSVETAYRVGLTGADSRQVKFFNDTQRLAFEAGKSDKQVQDRVKQAKAQNAAVYNTGFTENEHSAKLTSAEREMFSTFANDFKMDVRMSDKIVAYYVNGKAREANASHVNGKMEVSSTSELPTVAVAMHEGFHRMRQLDPVATDALMNFLYETSDQNVKRLKVGDTGVSNFERIKGEYSNVEGMEALDYIEEIACRRSETIFSSPEAYNEWRAKLEMNPQAKSAWQKLLEVIRELLEDMWATITNSKMSLEAKRQAQKELELFADAYRGAMKAADTRLQAVESQKKTETQTETRSNVTESPVASENKVENKETPTKPKNKPQVKKKAVKVGETYTANRTGKTYTVTERTDTHTTYTVTDKNGKTTTRKTTNGAADINFNRAGDEGFTKVNGSTGIKAGDVFTATGTTYKIVSRDAQNTKVEISSENGTKTMVVSNEVADSNFSNMSDDGITKWIDEDMHIDNRTWEDVGDRKVKAFQFLFPEMKDYYTPLANELLGDLDNTIQGERMKIGSYEMGNEEWIGTERFTSEAIATIKDNTNATYDDIRNALNRLINDEGQENIALAKRIELVFDEMLTDGYNTFDGMQIPPNEEYITKKEALIGKEYKKYEPSEWDEDLPFFSLKKADEKAPTFYSHMGKTIDGIKQDKIGASSVVSYLKGRGVKDEEIKWTGIETFLEGKKSVTKAELQEFVAGSMLQIETKTLSSDGLIEYTEDESKSLSEMSEVINEYWEKIDNLWMDKYGEEIPWYIRFNDNAEDSLRLEIRKLQRTDTESDDFFRQIYNILGNIRTIKHNEDAIIRRATERTNLEKGNSKTKYGDYTLDGGSNYRELLFKLPNSEYTNDSMSYHWGEEGILAHARIQDFDVDGQKMLFIEEIQSDWHNEGAKKGYADKGKAKQREKFEALREKNKAERKSLIEELSKHYEGKVAIPEESAERLLSNIANDKSNFNALIKRDGISDTLAERIVNYEIAKVEEALQLQESLKKGVEDAPFRNNYHEYVLKNLLRMAAEEGYDSIGWTTADIQSQRWSDDYAEGYRIEYDQDIPKFLNKYGKKWGAKVGTTVIGREEGHWEDKARWVEKEGTEVWSMPITDSMKNSVLYEGQPMFSLKAKDQEYLELAKDPKKNKAKLNKMVKEAAKEAGYTGTYYHGSKGDFTVFKKEFAGKSNSNASIGFWFTETEEGAKNWINNIWWGDNEKGKVYKTYLRLNNPKVYETLDTKAQRDELYKGYESIDKEMSLYDDIYYFDDGRRYHTERYDYDKSKRRRSGISEWDAFKAIVKKYDADTIDYYLSKVAESEREIVKKDAERYVELNQERKALEKQITELRYYDAYELFRTDMYKQIGLGAEDANIGGTGKYVENEEEMLKKYVDMLKQEGYDGIIIKGTAYDTSTFGENNNQYLVLDSNQVKSAEPVTYDDKGKVIPLSERFNTKNDDIRYSLKDSEGKSLTKEQSEYFKDSKIRDKEGNLLVMYHGTTRGGFTVFDGGKDYWYFTNDKKYSYAFEGRKKNGQFYPYTKERMEKGEATPQRYKVYLNVKNPYIADIDTVEDALYWDRSLAGLLREKGFDALMVEDMSQVIVLNANQIKNTTNKNPSAVDDIRHSLKNGVDVSPQKTTDYLNAVEGVQKGKKGAAERLAKYVDEGMIRTEAYDALIEKYGVIPSGERPHRDVQVPRKSGKKKNVSQTVRTILEAKATPDEAVPTIEKMVEDGIFSYDVYTDKAAIEDGENYIKTHGWEQSLIAWFEAVNSGEVSKEITTTGWILYNHAANKGDTKTAIMILDAMVRCQRSAAQALQATRILKKLSPESQLYGVQQSVEAFQKELINKYGDKAPDLQINEELAEKFLTAETEEERLDAEIEIYKDIGRQMPSNWMDKWNAWRYVAMLTNPRTHIRNILGNAFFAPVVATKNLTATVIESMVAPVVRLSGREMIRGKAFVWSSKTDRALLKAAWNDYSNVADIVSNGGKYNDSAMGNKYIQEGRRIFKGILTPVEWVRRGNSKLLELEDMWFSQPHYAYALAQYCKANNITPEQIQRGKAIAPAREYAIREAQKATYKDTNAFSQMVSEVGRHGKRNWATNAKRTLAEGVLPFRKTPANILARGVEYSPIGFIKSLFYDLHLVKKGKMQATEAIDNISSGFTGSMLFALGAYLAAQGLIRGHGEEEKDEKEFKELMGHQAYSLELPNGQSVTLDWLAPESLPFFTGVSWWEIKTGDKKDLTLADLQTALNGISDPMLEMSFLQGLNDALASIGYAQSNEMKAVPTLISTIITSYLSQGIPTLFGQIERTGEEERMTTFTEKDGNLTKDTQYALGKASAKIPFWDYNQIPYIDAWGRKEASGTALKRGLNNFLNPAYQSTIETSDMENELLRLYEQTGEASVFPSRADKKFTVDGEDKYLTADEYVRYATLKGEKSYKAVTDLVNSRAYDKLSDAEKVKAIEDAYDYANQKAKEAIGNYKPQSWVGKADGFANVGNYLAFKTEVASTKEAKGDNFSKQDVVDIILDMAQNDSETWKLYLSEYDAKKDLAIHDAGIGAEEYMTVIQNVDKYDEPNKNGNLGTYTNDEIATAISATDGLTKKDKAILWQEMTGSKSTKNNPWRRYLP